MTPQPTAHATSPSQRATPVSRPATPLNQPTPVQAWATDSTGHDQPETQAPDSSFGLPADRQARMAARRAFVALKLSFLYVVDGLEGKTELQARVRLAEEPEELWDLRAPVFAALSGDDAQNRSRRQLLNRSLESMFPTATPQLN